MSTKVFLDLEQTVIDSWDNPLLMNVEKIRDTLDLLSVTEVGIFSFAIWNDEDKVDFEKRGIKLAIENALNVKITQILTIPQIAKEIFWKTGMQLELTEFITLWGKQRAFIDWAMVTHQKTDKDTTIVLIDDVVQNLTITDHDRGIIIELMKI